MTFNEYLRGLLGTYSAAQCHLGQLDKISEGAGDIQEAQRAEMLSIYRETRADALYWMKTANLNSASDDIRARINELPNLDTKFDITDISEFVGDIEEVLDGMETDRGEWR